MALQCQKQSQEQRCVVDNLKQIRQIQQSELESMETNLRTVQSDHCAFEKELGTKLSHLSPKEKFISVSFTLHINTT